jgi:uncharacterized membrane protein SpoIIM required for sporulation
MQQQQLLMLLLLLLLLPHDLMEIMALGMVVRCL